LNCSFAPIGFRKGALSPPDDGLSALQPSTAREISPMALTSHMDSLKAKHTDLETRIADEERRPHPDENFINDLKKQKLRIKDELSVLVRPN
jgi:hypothetical protein